MSEGEQLLKYLTRLSSLVSELDEPQPHESWRRNAIRTVQENVDRYVSRVANALSSGSEYDLRRAACGTSSMRKGVADLGLFEKPRDTDILVLVEHISQVAFAICLSD